MRRAHRLAAIVGTIGFVAVSMTSAAAYAASGANVAGIVTSDSTTSLTVGASSTGSNTGAAATRLTKLKQKCDAAVQTRLTALDKAKSQIDASKFVTPDHKSGLETEVAADKSGLTSLDSTIQGDTTVQAAVTDCKNIVNDYRIFVLEVPKVHEVLAADALSQVDAALKTLAPKLATQLTAEQQAGADVSAGETALTDLNTRAAAIGTGVGPLASPVLAMQPSGWPGNKSTLKSTRSTLGSLVTSAKAARTDIQTISTALKNGKAKLTTTTVAPTSTTVVPTTAAPTTSTTA